MDIHPSSGDAPKADSAEAGIIEISELLGYVTTVTRFPPALERTFQSDMSAARLSRFLKVAIIGIFVYNSFIFEDVSLVPDILSLVIIVQLLIVSPILVVLQWLMIKRLLSPETSVTAALLAVFVSIMLFLQISESKNAILLIYTVPLCLAFGNVVLPLPFRQSCVFTAFCLLTSTTVLLLHPGRYGVQVSFSVLVNCSCAVYILIGTFRMEVGERRAFLFNRREVFRAEKLAASNRLLKNLSETDGLTGLPNRRYFDAELARLCEAASDPQALSLLLLDIDHFKKLNDTFGHDVGDTALRTLSECLRQHAPPGAIIARYGGEEFMVLLPGAGPAYARSCAETIRSAVGRLAEGNSQRGLPRAVTVSIGIVSVASTVALVPAAFVKSADQALYRCKANGRNRVECASGRVVTGIPAAAG